ncbi:MAG: flagellar hook-basal body complex protein, partial [Candidatus Afipia apatlaquensis]|nr:flagellar hook-basal body complex protein [Candidatus Afipia apatlaquensis]
MSDKSIIGLSRLVTLRQQVDTVARNIANQSTTGYKSEGLRFREYLTEAKEEDVRSSPLRSLVAATVFTDFSAGPLQATGNSTDVAMIGDGFFVVAVPGGERYT